MTKPKSAAEIWKMATPLMREDRWLDAIELLTDPSSESAKNWKLSWNLGWCYFKLDRFDDAWKHMIRADKLAPGNAICKWALGLVLLKRKRFKKSAAVLAESLRIKESHLTRIALALAYLAQGKIPEAEKIHIENIKHKTRRSERYESYAAFLSDVGREAESERIMQKVRAMRSVN